MKHLSFNQFIWIVTALVIGYLIAGPSLMDAWAYHTWKEVPCHLGDRGRYFYELDGLKYVSARRDFWQLAYTSNPPTKEGETFEPDATCWVNPRQPIESVLTLDAHKNWDNSVGRIAASAFLLVCVWGVLHVGLKKKARHAAADQGGGGGGGGDGMGGDTSTRTDNRKETP